MRSKSRYYLLFTLYLLTNREVDTLYYKEMLARRLRFHGHGSLKYLYKNAATYRSRFFTVRAITNPRRNHSRVAVVVSKKVHKSAVGRNRIRRRLYEIIRHELPYMNQTMDIAVIVTSGEVRTSDSQELTRSLQELLRQTGNYAPDTK